MNKDKTLFWPPDEISVRGPAKLSEGKVFIPPFYSFIILCSNHSTATLTLQWKKSNRNTVM